MKKLYLIIPFLFVLLGADSIYTEQDFKDGLITKDIDVTGDDADGDGYIQFQNQSGDAPTPGSGTEHVNVFAKSKKLYTAVDDGAGTPIISEIGSGAGGSGVNYITNGDFESTGDGQDVSGWVLYDDGDVPIPDNGVDGSPSGSYVKGETTGALRGNVMGVLHKPIGMVRGYGWSYDFTIDPADKAKMLTVHFDYDVSSAFEYGTFDDCVNDPSDTTVWMYDVDNSQLIQLSNYCLSGAKTFDATFQTDATSDDYRLIFHQATNNGSGVSLYIDNLSVGPQRKVIGPPITPETEYTTTVAGVASSTNVFLWSRIGDKIKVKGSIILGANATATITFTLPDGIDIDTSKLPAGTLGTSASYEVGKAWLRDVSASLNYNGRVVTNSTDTNRFQMVTAADGVAEAWTQTHPGPDGCDSGDVINIELMAPVTGWSSNTLMSSEGESRTVGFLAIADGTQSVTDNTEENTQYKTVIKDTHNAWNDTDIYTVKTAGWYNISAAAYGSFDMAVGTLAYINLKHNSTSYLLQLIEIDAANAGKAICLSGSVSVYAIAGDTFTIRNFINYNSGSPTFTNLSRLSIHRIADPSAIAATEIVAARFQRTNTTALATNTVIDFEDTDFDTHSMQSGTGTSWKWYAPYAGFYKVTCSATWDTQAWAEGDYTQVIILKSNAEYATVGFREFADAIAAAYQVSGGSAIMKLNAGDYISCKTSLSRGAGSPTFLATGLGNYIEIHRIGGVMLILIPFWQIRRRKKHIFDDYKLAA